MDMASTRFVSVNEQNFARMLAIIHTVLPGELENISFATFLRVSRGQSQCGEALSNTRVQLIGQVLLIRT
jgi:hypothetical protein